MFKVSQFLFRVAIAMGSGLILASNGSASAQVGENTPVNSLLDRQESDILLIGDEVSQVSSVSQLSDVKPTDWAFSALQSLVERYGVIAGYPDRTYRGAQPISRYEFAAGLNTALDKINELLASGLADKVSKEDLATLQKLQEQFAPELASIKDRVTKLETKTAKIEAEQFSTTTVLRGSINFLLAGETSSGKTERGSSKVSNAFFAYGSTLRLNTSFSGKDTLSISFAASNPPSLSSTTGTPLANLSFDSTGATVPAGSFGLAQLWYRLPLGDKATIWFNARGLPPFEFFPLISPLRSAGSVPSSTLGLFSPAIFRPGLTTSGLGVAYRFSDQWQLHAAYNGTALSAADATPGRGIFNGASSQFVQLTYTPSRQFSGSLNYAHKYWTGVFNPNDGYGGQSGQISLQSVGTNLSLSPFTYGLNGTQYGVPTTSDTFGGQFDWRIFPKVGLGGWFSTTNANNLSTGTSATIITAALSLGFFDLFKEGNHGGLLFAIPPYVASSNNPGSTDKLTPYHIEAFYTHRISKFITITPDIYVILNPDNGTADPIWVGSLRTTFTF